MQKKESKQFSKIKKLIKKTHSKIKEKDFHNALHSYTEAIKIYKYLPESRKTEKVEKEIETLHKELTIYLRLNEAYIMAEQGNLEHLKQELQEVHNLVFELESGEITEDIESLLEYASKNYKHYLNVYSKKLSKRDFEKTYNSVLNNIQKREMSKAKKEYTHILMIYKKLHDSLDETEKLRYYKRIKRLFQELYIVSMLQKATKKPRYIHIEPVEIEHKEIKPHKQVKKQYHEFTNDYKKLRTLLKKGDIITAEDILKSL